MRTRFRSIDDVFGSPFLQQLPAPRPEAQGGNRVLKSTRIEDSVYQDLRQNDVEMDAMEEECLPKLPTFPDLSRDIYQSFYSLNIRRNPPEELSSIARQSNTHIMDSVMDSGESPTIKAACEGRQLPAYERHRNLPPTWPGIWTTCSRRRLGIGRPWTHWKSWSKSAMTACTRSGGCWRTGTNRTRTRCGTGSSFRRPTGPGASVSRPRRWAGCCGTA